MLRGARRLLSHPRGDTEVILQLYGPGTGVVHSADFGKGDNGVSTSGITSKYSSCLREGFLGYSR